MNLARRFLRYNAADRLLLFRAMFVVVLVRLGLKVLRFQNLRKVLRKTAKEVSKPYDQEAVFRTAWAVAAVSRHVPLDATCLTQAVAAEVLLSRMGQPSVLRIGVAKDGDELEAHAWLEIDGEVIIGDNVDLSRYKTLPSIEAGTR